MTPDWDVLVVDDEPVVRDAIRLVLEQEGLRIAQVPDAEAALAHPALADCRLLICDLMLPGAPGSELVRAVRALRPTLPIVLVTGYATAETAAKSLASGATAFLAKPFDDLELLDLVRHVLPRADVTGKGGRP